MRTVEDVIATIKGYKDVVVEKTKALTTESVEPTFDLAINDKNSLEALGILIKALNKIETTLYDASIVKMELRGMYSGMGDSQRKTALGIELRKALDMVGDCVVIVKNRYDYMIHVLNTMKSINSNLRHFSVTSA